MGRPTKPSPETVQKIYVRLNNGPFWLDDWKSTGIRSRSTVNLLLKKLKAKELLIDRREGHKHIYEINYQKGRAGWWDLFHTDAELKALKRDKRRLTKELESFLKQVGNNISKYAKVATLSKDKKKYEFRYSNADIVEALGLANSEISSTEVIDICDKIRRYELCPECLVIRNRRVKTIDKGNNCYCPICGLEIFWDARAME